MKRRKRVQILENKKMNQSPKTRNFSRNDNKTPTVRSKSGEKKNNP